MFVLCVLLFTILDYMLTYLPLSVKKKKEERKCVECNESQNQPSLLCNEGEKSACTHLLYTVIRVKNSVGCNQLLLVN